jgi:hypothetical protein
MGRKATNPSGLGQTGILQAWKWPASCLAYKR